MTDYLGLGCWPFEKEENQLILLSNTCEGYPSCGPMENGMKGNGAELQQEGLGQDF